MKTIDICDDCGEIREGTMLQEDRFTVIFLCSECLNTLDHENMTKERVTND